LGCHRDSYQKAFTTEIDHNPNMGSPLEVNQEREDVKEIVEFWDSNGFGFTNINGKQQLLSWSNKEVF
jgi:hypothetical protein